jgi:hypothetical protein
LWDPVEVLLKPVVSVAFCRNGGMLGDGGVILGTRRRCDRAGLPCCERAVTVRGRWIIGSAAAARGPLAQGDPVTESGTGDDLAANVTT